jgi:hypothetical protein
MVGLLEGDIDAAEAMTYNEYAQVLEAINPDTGELYTPDDFNVISYEDEGVGMLQDAIWADGTRLADEAYKDTAVNFVAASLQGWAYCRDNVEACADIVSQQGSALGLSHQLWQMNEVNKLIWPAEGGVGFIDQAAWDRTAIAVAGDQEPRGQHGAHRCPDAEAYTNDIVTAAHALLDGDGCRHQRRRVRPDRSHPHRGRRLTSSDHTVREGRVAPAARPSRVAPHGARSAPWFAAVVLAASPPRPEARPTRRRRSPLRSRAGHACRLPRRCVPGDQLGHALRHRRADRRPAPGDHRCRLPWAAAANGCGECNGRASRWASPE